MIRYRERILEETKGWEYWKIRLYLTRVPEYSCTDISDFLKNQRSLKIGEEAHFHKLRYFPADDADSGLIRITLEDSSRKRLTVYVQGTEYDEKAGENVLKMLRRVHAAEELRNVIIRNGQIMLKLRRLALVDPTMLLEIPQREEAYYDQRLYLSGFENSKGVRKISFTETLQKYLLLENQGQQLVPVPVKR